jgi:DNA-binding response OmpR family regulator
MQTYNLERLNILIVDDNKHMQILLKEVLRAFGVRNVRTSDDGADAFKEMKVFAADIVICDWSMQPLDGLDFVRLVRTASDSPNPTVPIIMLTGHTEMHRIVEARDSGVNEFLAKPVSAEGLYKRIVSIVESPRKFIKSPRYVGPDRRRHKGHFDGPERRRPEAGGRGSAGLSQDDVAALFARP